MTPEEFVAQFGGGSAKTTPTGWVMRCPAHDDEHASLTVGRAASGKFVLYCHAGCTFRNVLAAAGLRMKDVLPPLPRERQAATVLMSYEYRDAQGEIVYIIDRLEGKQFRPRHMVNGEWTPKMPSRRVLYRYPELLVSDKSSPIWIVEGEKDANSLASRGLVATTHPGGASNHTTMRLVYDDPVFDGRDILICPDNDAPGLAMARFLEPILMRRAASVRRILLPGDAKDVSDFFALGRTVDDLLAIVRGDTVADTQAPCVRSRMNVVVDTDEKRVVDDVLRQLATDDRIFIYGGNLTAVIDDRMTLLTAPQVRTVVAEVVALQNNEGKSIHVPTWLAAAVQESLDWTGFRKLRTLSPCPIIRIDGSVHLARGWDQATESYYIGEPMTLPAMSPEECIRILDEVICDFDFESESGRAAWYAALLTAVARITVDGACPLFLFDANIRGAGKGLLAQTISVIVTGHTAPVSLFTNDDREMGQRILSSVIEGAPIVLWDNLVGVFGGPAIEALITTSRFSGRILRESRNFTGEVTATFFATGNNVALTPDMMRRTIPIRLMVREEFPEDRNDFRHGDLLGFCRANRHNLLASAICMVSSFLSSGERFDVTLGSFEGWSRVVRECIMWARLPDPMEAQKEMRALSDPGSEVYQEFLIAAYEWFGSAEFSAMDAFAAQHRCPELKTAMESMIYGRSSLTARAVGYKLRSIRDRIIAGYVLRSCGRSKWMIEKTT